MNPPKKVVFDYLLSYYASFGIDCQLKIAPYAYSRQEPEEVTEFLQKFKLRRDLRSLKARKVIGIGAFD